MNAYQLGFDHLGLAVTRPDRAVRFLRGLGYHVGEPVYDPEQKVNLILCRHARAAGAHPDVELIYAADEPGPLTGILSNRRELIYHTCYVSGDVDASLRLIREDRNTVVEVSPPTPAVLFGGKRVSFYMVLGFGLIEIIETPGVGEETASG